MRSAYDSRRVQPKGLGIARAGKRENRNGEGCHGRSVQAARPARAHPKRQRGTICSQLSTFGTVTLVGFSAWWLALGIDLERSRPGCPQDNGAHERLHLDISRQLERAGYTERQAAFDLWRKEFNEERPHEALGMRFPSEVYRDSERKYEGAPEKLLYPGIESRRVKLNGMINFEGKVYFLSTALAGWDVGLAPVEGGRWEVRFGRLVLGHLETATEAFLPIVAPTSQEVPKAA